MAGPSGDQGNRQQEFDNAKMEIKATVKDTATEKDKVTRKDMVTEQNKAEDKDRKKTYSENLIELREEELRLRCKKMKQDMETSKAKKRKLDKEWKVLDLLENILKRELGYDD